MKEISKQIVIKYFLLQIPGLAVVTILVIALEKIFALPGSIKFIVIPLWIVKDLVMFPFVWRSYGPSDEILSTLVGKRGKVQKRLAPEGLVRLDNELWKAVVANEEETVEAGEFVIVEKVTGLVLTVSAE